MQVPATQKKETQTAHAPGQALQSAGQAIAGRLPASLPECKLSDAVRDSPVRQMQGAFKEAVDNSPRQAAQRKEAEAIQAPRPNKTGMPDRLKAGVESLSGLAMDDVRVHYNSDRPARVQALAYAQGTDIHLGPGQERHLPHEAWHVVQQKQGRVQATRQLKGGVKVNDDKGLEAEADAMGNKASTEGASSPGYADNPHQETKTGNAIQASATPDSVVQREFAVQVVVEEKQGARKIASILFGERPSTQFGSKQEDHVMAWAGKLAEIRMTLLPAESLKDAVMLLMQILNDADSTLGIKGLEPLIDTVRNVYTAEGNDEFRYLQTIQNVLREYLEIYNKHELSVRKRVGPADKTEGARVKKAKDELINDKPKSESEVAENISNLFQFEPKKNEIELDKKKGFPVLTQAFSNALLTAHNMLGEGSANLEFKKVAGFFILQQFDKLKLQSKKVDPKADSDMVFKEMEKNHIMQSLFE